MTGIITPLITPFINGTIDVDGVKALMSHLKKMGIAAVFPMGSMGLFSAFDASFHRQVLKLTVDATEANMPVFAGIGRNNISDTIAMGKYAKDLGVDAVVVVSPYYLKMSDNSMYNYFATVADGVDHDIIVYNIPQYTGNPISADLLNSLIKSHPNIVGIKDSSTDIRSIQAYIGSLPGDIMIFHGQDDLLLASLSVGATGGVCGTSNFSPLATEVFNAWKGGGNATVQNKRLIRLMHMLSSSEFPKPYYYLFQRMIMGRNSPSRYLPPPFGDMDGASAEALYGEVEAI